MCRIRPFALVFLIGCSEKGVDVADCDVVGTEALPDDEDLPSGVAEGLALYDAMAGAWTVALACADGSAPTASLTITATGRDAFELETWDGAGCDETNVARGPTAVVIADWTHGLDASLDTSIHEDGTVRISGGSATTELELNAWAEEVHGIIRVPWPDDATAKDVVSETASDPMDCTFEGWTAVE